MSNVVAVLAVLVLGAAACGSDGDSIASESAATGGGQVESGADAGEPAGQPGAADDQDDGDGDGEGQEDGGEAAEGVDGGSALPVDGAQARLGPFVASLFEGGGVEPTDELVDCMEGKGVDLQLDPLDASEADLALTGVALFGCAPDEMAPAVAADTEPPPGTDRADVLCVAAETFRYLGQLPVDEAVAALEADTVPESFRAALGSIAADVCDLSSADVLAIFDA